MVTLMKEKRIECHQFTTYLKRYLREFDDVKQAEAERRKTFLKIMRPIRDKNWDEVLAHYQTPEMQRYFSFDTLEGLDSRQGFWSLLALEKAPVSFFDQMMEAGYQPNSMEVFSIIARQDYKTIVEIEGVLLKHDMVLEPSYGGHSLYDYVARHPDKTKGLQTFLKNSGLDPNLVLLSKDALTTALETIKRTSPEKQDLSALKLLLEKGAVVTPEHYGLAIDKEVNDLLHQYECRD